MKIGGYQKYSRTDFPGKIAAVVYTQGCSWRCPYCHSRALVLPSRFQPSIPLAEVFAHIESALGYIDAVVVTGGEPTQQNGLADFLRRVRGLGLATKLDTNGANPGVLDELLFARLLDFIAIDVKGPLHNYARYTGCRVDTGAIEVSLELIRTCGVAYELRTTLVGGLHTENDLHDLAPLIAGATRYSVQTYQPALGLREKSEMHPASSELRDYLRTQVAAQVGEYVER